MINENDEFNESTLELPDDDDNNLQGWTVTLADLMMLLLTFFVLLYSMSNIDKEKYAFLADSLRKTYRVESKIDQGTIINEQDFEVEAKNITSVNDILNTKLDEILKNINIYIYQHKLQNVIRSYIDERGVVINISDKMLFKPGDDKLNPQSQNILNYIMELFQTFPYPILIEGHTDNTPINTLKFPSNWELSTHRSCNVIRYFIAKGIKADRLSAEGFGEYRPIASNQYPSGRSMNRRVEVIFKRSGIMKTIQDIESKN